MGLTPNTNLCFRRQFILGPRYARSFPQWQTMRAGPGLVITAHPDLPILNVSGRQLTLTLAGFMLDPQRPEDSNDAILNRLLEQHVSFAQTVLNTYALGGRWALVFSGNDTRAVLHDAVGSRQVYFCRCDKHTWCASQPHLLAHELHVPERTDTELACFLSSELYAQTERAWPGDETIFAGIRHLLPNHYLDLGTAEPVRYWPQKKLSPLPVDAAADRGGTILTGLLQSASARSGLSLAITSGWDSRVMLAASKSICKSAMYYIVRFGKLNPDSPDIRVPAALCERLGLDFNVIEPETCAEPGFEQAVERNVCFLQSEKKKVLLNAIYKNLSHKLNVSGSAGEIARNYYVFRRPVTAETLAYLFRRPADAYTVRQFGQWLSEARSPAAACGIDLLDLFYWEQRMGNWGVNLQAAMDTAIDEFFLFNCRSLLETLLSVDRKFRHKKDNVLFRQLIRTMWPETLQEPINPPVGAAAWLEHLLLQTKLYNPLQHTYHAIKHRFVP